MQQSSILPSQCRDFMTQSYWEKFFKKIKKEGADSEYFEWYGDYQAFEHLFRKHIQPKDSVLHIGCGKSLLAEQLYDNGVCKHILNVDFEPKSLEQMAARSKKRTEMGFQCLSLLDKDLPLKEHDVILDKGTLDAIYPHTLKQTEVIEQFFVNMSQALRPGGKYLIVSLLQEHIIEGILKFFDKGWDILIYETVIEKSKLYPFFVVITKVEQGGTVKISLLNQTVLNLSRAEAVKQVKQIQLQNHFITQVHKLRQGQNFTLDLWSTTNKNTPRYTLQIYDNDNPNVLASKTCACFIVPQGKENSYIFGSFKGHKELQKQANMSRLIVARMNAGHIFANLKQVQSELSPAVLELSPKGCTNKPCPFLTDGDDISEKCLIFETEEFIVEEFVGEEEQVFRRVVQKSNLDQTQSQVRLKQTNIDGIEGYNGLLKPKKGLQVGFDGKYLDFQAHTAMVAGLVFLTSKIKTRVIEVLILGGGTGSLSQFLVDHFPNIKITNIELSDDMIMIARKFFNYVPSERQQMINCDALDYIDQIQGNHLYDCVIIDINSSDNSGVSPPPPFLAPEFFKKLESVLSEDGISLVILNLVDRFQVTKTLPWDIYYSVQCEDEVNEVYNCFMKIYFLMNKKLSKDGEGRVIMKSDDLEAFTESLKGGAKSIDQIRTSQWDLTNLDQYISSIKLRQPKLSSQAFQTSEVTVMKDGQAQEGRKEFYQQDLQKVEKKKNKRKKTNKNR